ncbi:MAG: TolC family protein, partial [Rubrivivax sp.]
MPLKAPFLIPLVRPRRIAPTLLAAITAALLWAGSVPARAQNLLDLYTAARGYDATYQAALSTARAAEYRAEQSAALNRPLVTMQGTATTGGTDYPYNRGVKGTTTANGSINGRLPLFNRANDATIAQSRRLLESARADLEAARQALIVRVAQAYFDVLAAQDTLTTTRTSKAAISEQLASAKRNFEVGTATITDTREAQARFDLATAQEIVATNDLQTKRVALDQLVGRSNVTPNQLVVPVALPATAPANIDEWVTRADEEHPLVRKARLGFEVAQLETEKAKAGHLPTVDLSASYTRGHASIRGDSRALNGSAQGFDISGANNGSAIAVTLNVPLFAGYAIQNRVKETLVLEDKARNDLEAARRGVAQGTR